MSMRYRFFDSYGEWLAAAHSYDYWVEVPADGVATAFSHSTMPLGNTGLRMREVRGLWTTLERGWIDPPPCANT